MKLLLLSHSRNDRNAGASRIYHLLNDGFRTNGHDVRTLHFEDYAPIPIGPLQRGVDKLLRPQFISFRASAEARCGYDVIMASNGSAYPLFRSLRRDSERPLLVNHIHGLELFDRQALLFEQVMGRQRLSQVYQAITGPILTAWDARGIQCADLNIVQNDRDFDFVLRCGIPASRIVRITPGVLPEIMAASATAPPARSRASDSLLWFGSWEARKGVYALPTAFELILDQVPNATLTIGGVGKQEAEIVRAFSARAAERVRVLPRISLQEQFTEFGRNAIFLFPSLSEGYGLAVIEAMALGLAVVTTNTGVGGDSLRDGETAMIVPQGSALHLARAVVSLIGDTTRRSLIASNGQTFARTLSTQQMISSYEDAFSEKLRNRNAA